MCVQGTRPEYRKIILFIGAGNHTLQTPDTDEHVDPGRSKQKMKEEAEDSMLPVVWKGSFYQPYGSQTEVLQEQGLSTEGQVRAYRHVVFKKKCK